MEDKALEKLKLEMKEVLEKQHGRELTSLELEQAFNFLILWAELAVNRITEEFEMQKKLKDSPKGYLTKGKGNCCICNKVIADTDSWYDEFGMKCLLCQEAINSKIIPSSIVLDEESWYSTFELGMYFNFDKKMIQTLINDSEIKCRTIKNEKGKVHFRVFLMKENKEVLPPKKLLKSRYVKTLWKGEDYFTDELWYQFLDEKLAKKLRKYSIMPFLKDSLEKPCVCGQMYFKGVNPLFTLD